MPSDELGDLAGNVEALRRQLDALHETYGGALAELAAVDWQALGRQGRLAGTPRLAIERTIEDARNVLSAGREALALVLQQAADPEMVANPDLDIPGRLRAVIRLYTDTPNDLRKPLPTPDRMADGHCTGAAASRGAAADGPDRVAGYGAPALTGEVASLWRKNLTPDPAPD